MGTPFLVAVAEYIPPTAEDRIRGSGKTAARSTWFQEKLYSG
jgi:hypothetical protein